MSLKLGINENITNSVYHSDKTYLSSSNLKTLLKDPMQFYKEKILGEREERSSASFDEGTYTHLAILEPHLLEQEVAIYDGWRKYGQDWENFKEANEGKLLLSKPQKFRCDEYVKAFERNEAAVAVLKGGAPEYTICSKILDVPVKIRADYINIDKGYIADIKTTGYGAGTPVFKNTVQQFMYQLSAALYCQVAYDHFGKLFDFYFIVISKTDLQCDVYKASPTTLNEGHSLVNKALVLYKKCLDTGLWKLDQPMQHNFGLDYEIEEV